MSSSPPLLCLQDPGAVTHQRTDRQRQRIVIPAKRSARRDRKKMGASICYDPGKASPFRDGGSGEPLARPAKFA
jgi:hypothetical protein